MITIFLQGECLGSSRDLTMSAPSKSHTCTVVKTKVDTPVIVISDEETKEIPDPFPFPATYSANVDVALHKGTEAVLQVQPNTKTKTDNTQNL